MFQEHNWTPSLGEVYCFLRELFDGGDPPWNGGCGDYDHPVYGYAYNSGFDAMPLLPRIQAGLDELGWQVLGLGWQVNTAKGDFPCVVAAPRLVPTPPVGNTVYHVTEWWRWNQRIQYEGLLPGSDATSHTDRWDGLGKCFVSVQPHSDESADGATHWRRVFAEQYRRLPTNYVILEIDVHGLEVRAYRDPFSAWGVILDQFGCIEPGRLRKLTDEEVADAEQRSVWACPSLGSTDECPPSPPQDSTGVLEAHGVGAA